MKAFLRWLARVVGSAITIVLVIVMFPHISRLAARLLPDESGAAVRTSAILASKLENSARLETLRVAEEGVLHYDIHAALLGSVASINASYLYAASFGIDLQQVTMHVSGNVITFSLPPVELLQDSLTPKEVYRDDFWYPGFSDSDYEQLIEEERLARRAAFLTDKKEELWNSAVEAFENTISTWLTDIDASLIFQYQPMSNQQTN